MVLWLIVNITKEPVVRYCFNRIRNGIFDLAIQLGNRPNVNFDGDNLIATVKAILSCDKHVTLNILCSAKITLACLRSNHVIMNRRMWSWVMFTDRQTDTRNAGIYTYERRFYAELLALITTEYCIKILSILCYVALRYRRSARQ